MEQHSKSHIAYLKKQKQKVVFIHAMRIAILLLIIALWEVFSACNIIDPFIMSSPSRIIATFSNLLTTGNLMYHMGITLFETMVGFLIATVLGTLFAICNWWSDITAKIAEPYLVILNSLPKIALGPIIIIWFGPNYNAIICMTVLICIIITVITVENAFKATDPDKIQLLRGMGANKLTVFTKLVFPSSLKTIISMLKINVGLSFVGSIMGEYLVSRAGIGHLIVYGGQVFNLDLVLTCTIILMFMSGVIYYAVSLLEKLVVRF